jgi:uncharacterized protein YdhG (YjbR/CyaY superfamily)
MVTSTARLMGRSKDVDSFIEAAPKEFQPKLREIRAAIRKAAPTAVESISYGMPFYSFPGESGFGARLCYFGLRKQNVVFYTRPVFLEEYASEVEPYLSTKSALHFLRDRPIPVRLIQKLVRNGVKKHTTGSG